MDGKKVQNVLKGEQRIAVLTTRPKRCVTGAGNKRPALQTIRVQVGIVGKRNSTGVDHRELSSAGRTGRKRCDAPPVPSDWWT